MSEAIRDELIAEVNRLSTQGLLHHKGRRLDESEDFRRQALVVMEQALGPDNPEIAEKLNDLAWVLSSRGKHEQAEIFLQRSLAFLDQPHHPKQRTVLQRLEHLARNAVEQGRVIDAERMYQRSLTVRERILGQTHPSIARIKVVLADVRRDSELADRNK